MQPQAGHGTLLHSRGSSLLPFSHLSVTLVFLEALGCLWCIKHYCSNAVLTASPNPAAYGAELLRKYHENLSEILIDNQVLLKVISRVKSLAPGDREVSSREGDCVYTCISIFYKYIEAAMLGNAKKENWKVTPF